MIPLDIDQLLLSFERPAAMQSPFLLHAYRNMLEYFHQQPDSYPPFPVDLPHRVQETVFGPLDHDWRRTPRESAAAKDLGFRMWRRLPPAIQNDITSGTPSQPRRVASVMTQRDFRRVDGRSFAEKAFSGWRLMQSSTSLDWSG